MYFPRLKLDVKPEQQFFKIIEEFKEYRDEILQIVELKEKATESDILKANGEGWDQIFAIMNTMFTYSDYKQVKQGYVDTVEKLKQRNENKEIQIEEFLEF